MSLYNRGVANEKLGNLEASISDFTRVLSLDPSHVNAAYARAACHNKGGNFARAIEDYNLALSKDATGQPHRRSPARHRSPAHQRKGSFAMGAEQYVRSRERELREKLAKTPISHNGPGTSALAGLMTPHSNSPRPGGFGPSGTRHGTPSSVASGAASTAPVRLSGQIDPPSGTMRPTAVSAQHGHPAAEGASANGSPSLASRRGHARPSVSAEGPPLHPDTPSGGSATPPWGATPGAAHPVTPSRALSGSGRSDATSSSSSPRVGPADGGTPHGEGDDDAADRHHARGFAHRRRGDFRAAIQEYSRAIELRPGHFKALFNRGFAHHRMGEYAQAVADYTAALEVDAHNAYAHYNRGISYDQGGDFERAVADFKRAIELLPTCADFHHNLAYVLRKRGEMRAALSHYDEALRLDPRHLKARLNRAVVLDKLQEWSRALADFTRAIEASPTASSFHSRALVQQKLNNAEAALADFTRAVEAEPNNALYRANRAFCLRSCGQFTRALEDYAIVVKQDRTNTAAWHGSGYCNRKLGNFTEAVSDFGKGANGLSRPRAATRLTAPPPDPLARQCWSLTPAISAPTTTERTRAPPLRHSPWVPTPGASRHPLAGPLQLCQAGPVSGRHHRLLQGCVPYCRPLFPPQAGRHCSCSHPRAHPRRRSPRNRRRQRARAAQPRHLLRQAGPL